MKKSQKLLLEDAALFAIRAHNGQSRKGSGAPYISHPLAVASLVMEYGGSIDAVIAALLHDVIEDCGVKLKHIEKKFGAKAAYIVAECSDFAGPKGAAKPAWLTRKKAYIARMKSSSQDTLLVSAADKLHNLRCTIHDLHHYGHHIWTQFNAKPEKIVWYYVSLLHIYESRLALKYRALVDELRFYVKALAHHAKEEPNRRTRPGRSRKS